MDIRRLSLSDVSEWAEDLRRPYQDSYLAMYSSLLGGIVTDPVLMTVPVDDHLVHRGDGVFETLKCVDGSLYNLDAHLDRLETSGRAIGLEPPIPRQELAQAVIQTVRAGGQRDGTIRILVSRGPGSLGINPYDCPEPALYIVVARLIKPRAMVAERGATACFSAIPVKPGFFATIKSCNYLPNVLMKKEAVDAGVDFVLSLDEAGHLGEGAAESVAIVSPAHRFLTPSEGRILHGTTVARALVLGPALIEEGLLAGIEQRDITSNEVLDAREILILGTTPDVLAVVRMEGQPVGDGAPGPVARRLNELLQRDMRDANAVRTPVFDK